MRFYDTHVHFEDTDEVLSICARAMAAHVEKLLAIGGSAELDRNALRKPGLVALGRDRDQLDNGKMVETLMEEVRAALANAGNRVAAIGEIGLDCHYDAQTIQGQCELFAAQLALADELSLPAVIHTREADDATIGVLDEVPWNHTDRLRGVIHSYTGNPAFARKLLDRGFMISFSGIATFNRAENVRESVRYVPNDRILIETDSPFLAPVPLRGQRCEPAFVVHTAERLARERNTELAIFAETTFVNAELLFG